MLLERFRSLALAAVVFTTILEFFIFVGLYGLNSLYYRFLALVIICFMSTINLKFCNQIVRIEPITSIYYEWTDTKILDALFNSIDKSVPEIDSFSISDLVLDHYVFLGATRTENRNRVIAAFQARYPDAVTIDTSNAALRNQYIANVSERNSGMIDVMIPLFVLAETFDPKCQDMTKIGVYFFVASEIDQAINNKIVDGDTAKRIDPSSKVTLGFYDQKRKTIKQLKG